MTSHTDDAHTPSHTKSHQVTSSHGESKIWLSQVISNHVKWCRVMFSHIQSHGVTSPQPPPAPVLQPPHYLPVLGVTGHRSLSGRSSSLLWNESSVSKNIKLEQTKMFIKIMLAVLFLELSSFVSFLFFCRCRSVVKRKFCQNENHNFLFFNYYC